MSRRQYTDQYTNQWADEVTANASDGGVQNLAVFDAIDCKGVCMNVHITDTASNKKVKFKIQESDNSTTGFTDVADGANSVVSNVDHSTEYENTDSAGLKFYYAGIKRYVRLVVVSVGATPASKVKCLYQKMGLYDTPSNEGI